MKTNSGKAYNVIFKNAQGTELGVLIYATCKEHAEQIFRSWCDEGDTISVIEEDCNCISEHYEQKSQIPEFALAEDMMYAMIDVMLKSKTVPEYNADSVVDIACSMTKAALKTAMKEYHNKEKE